VGAVLEILAAEGGAGVVCAAGFYAALAGSARASSEKRGEREKSIRRALGPADSYLVRGGEAGGSLEWILLGLFNSYKGIHVVWGKRMCRNISKSVGAHQPCEPRIINDRWMKLNNDSVRSCQPLTRAVE
jgi:hypothetical protein